MNESASAPATLYKRAFDHPETRAAWEKEQGATKRRLRVWYSLYALALVYRGRDAIVSLKRIRRVLEQHPWESIPAAHRATGVKEVMGVPVRLRYLEGEELTGLLSARKPTRRRYWPEALESGPWYAGEVRLEADHGVRGFGVLAVPGEDELLEVPGSARVRRRRG
ncbi:hypothetical protein [Streptomyces sp. JW3]|uniref:hypothetical protein n=1 Tax=Streptomyces sp. JW3 TaxID=3456955 RepID=UPI003FA4497F